MNLKHIDIRPQALHARINSVENMLPRQSDTVDPFGAVIRRNGRDGRVLTLLVDAEEAFREDDDAGTWDVVFLKSFADDFFGFAVGVDVGLVVGGKKALIERID